MIVQMAVPSDRSQAGEVPWNNSEIAPGGHAINLEKIKHVSSNFFTFFGSRIMSLGTRIQANISTNLASALRITFLFKRNIQNWSYYPKDLVVMLPGKRWNN